MKKFIKRITLLLCAVMLMSLLGTTAIAADNEILDNVPAIEVDAKQTGAIGGDADSGYLTFETFEDLKTIAARTYNTFMAVHYNGSESTLTISENLTLPANVCLQISAKLVVPQGVTLSFTRSNTMTTSHTVQNLEINGVVNAIDNLDISHGLTVNGTLNMNGWIHLGTPVVISGYDNIHFANSSQSAYYVHNVYSDTDFYTVLEQAANDPYGLKHKVAFHPNEDVTFRTFAVPRNAEVTLHGRNDWQNPHVSYTIPNGVTVTNNGTLKVYASDLSETYPVLYVAGNLVNNSAVNLEYYDYDDFMLVFTGSGKYAGQGILKIRNEDPNGTVDWTVIISGLDTTGLEINQSGNICTIRPVKELIRLSAPKNLTWHVNTETVYDDSGKGSLQLVTRMGAISWETGEIRDPYVSGSYNTNYFIINLYRDGEAVLSHYGNIGFSDYYEKKGFPNCMEIPSNIEWESGTYYFTVQAVPNPMATDSEYRSSVVATSENWIYTKPANLDTPTNPTWNWPTMTWSSTSVKHKTEIEVEYAPTLNDEFQWAPGGAIYNNVTNEYTLTEYDLQNAANMCGAGYYRFRVRSRSLDITKNYHSAWSDYSDTYYFDGKYEVPEEEEIVLEAPTLKASNVASTGKIKLTWDAVPGAAKYEVYRATSKTGTYSLLKTLTGTSLTNTSVDVGKTYYYKIRAVDANGNKSDFSSIVSRACDLPQPTGLTATNVASTGKVKLTWTAVEGAAKYEVYRATSKDGTYTKLSTTTNTTLTNTSTTAGTTYYYKVKAIHSNSAANSAYSSVVSRACDLPQPTGLTATNVASSGKVKLSWTAVEGAAKYEVYRATSKSGTYSKIYTTTGTSLTNTSVEVGTTYYYKVKAIHSNSAANSAYSSVVSRACDLPQPKVTVTNVASTGKVKLSWTAVEGAAKYEVYRATSKDGTYTKLSTTTNTTLTNTSTTAGTTYYYKVKAIHSNSAANSAYSSIVSRTCDLAQPTLTVKLNSSGKPVLTWTKVEGAVSYKVYRATSKDGTYSLLKTLTGTSLTNTSVTAGKTYYYKVIAIHSNTAANSAYSAIKSITVK